ncbi:phenylphosphate carboxylase subunit delta [Pseudohongiella acticola]|jgi:3-deoxy-D-manno-octulosonate 8-phosphate phosphatase (KDO 8-P phosphatase)|uniref:3-deoxy-D-manno-octulosonate 8-phosphate phosphatase KdsC n=1 Tax=Pseudohongiella acticola TaxID=1524254 RepID=A0A1E8CFD2_9GAMM|nr:HAD-IIIA family hydrolase [Pseudohongiella acticola]OFE11170.1 phenylphosphate carboxylase subunit delta [Pseudohongiella acticola]
MKYYDTADEVLKRAETIRLLLLDVDGVMTNGQLYYGEHGEALKAFNTLDGQGIKLLQQNGIQVGIISGRKSAALLQRATALGITLMAQGREDKANALDELLQSHPCPLDQIAYVGDDLPDLLVMRRIGLPIAVPNAHESVHHCAALCTIRAGGEGAVRDVADFLLRAQGKYDEAVGAFM